MGGGGGHNMLLMVLAMKVLFLKMAAGIFCSHLTPIHPRPKKSSLHLSRPLIPPRLTCPTAGTRPTVPSLIPQPHPPQSGHGI